MQDWLEFIKGIVRPFIIIWGFIIYGICIMSGAEVPGLLTYLLSAIVIEYFGERAIKRFKESGREE